MPESDSDKPKVHNRIKALRRESGLSRRELAAAVKVNVNTLSVIERGEREPRITLACRIADYFGLPIKAVFSEEPMPSLADFLREQYPCSASGGSHTHHHERKEGESR